MLEDIYIDAVHGSNHIGIDLIQPSIGKDRTLYMLIAIKT